MATFREAAPYLFGNSSQHKMRDHMEAIRSLKHSQGSFNQHQSFQRSHPHRLELNNTLVMYAKFNKCIKVYHSSRGHKHLNQMPRVQYQGSLGDVSHQQSTGVRAYTSVSASRDSTQSTSVRGYTLKQEPATGVRDCTFNSSIRDVTISCPTQFTIPGLPILRLSIPLKDPPRIQLTQRGISPMAETILQSNQTIAGWINLFQQNWKAITQDPWIITFPSHLYVLHTNSPLHVALTVIQGSCSNGGGNPISPAEAGYL